METSPERTRMLDYLTTRAAALGPAELRARFRTAATELEAAVAGLDEATARRPPGPGEWSIAQVVDHVAQTTIRSAEELRHLLAGRRPPWPPVYEALTSGAAAWIPWSELLEGLAAAHAELDGILAGLPGLEIREGARVRAILVVNRTGEPGPDVFPAELDWREYALVQRLHALDHRTQVRAIRARLGV
jgi:hypothetical protein